MRPEINYEKPDLESALLKPLSFSNQPFSYNNLPNSRRFEELLYGIFSLKIQFKLLEDFDDVNLMSGVRDKGRDCNLIKGGRSYGLIQCKQYGKNYSKNDFGPEIVRFVLYSLADKQNNLVADYDDFTYYIAVSNGFTDDCLTFIDNFSNNITQETKLHEWVDKNLEMPTLSSLKDNFDYDYFRNIISKIKVKKIIPQDLDNYLNNVGFTHLISAFFEVRAVVDNSTVENLISTLKNESNSYSPEQLLEQLNLGSTRLQSEKNTFQNINNIHIDRSETAELFEWAKENAEKDENGIVKNICLLAGQAGSGKTVVIKDLYNLCKESSIAVLGLKADKLYSNSIADLQEKLGFDFPVYNTIKECKNHFEKVVILIDQIDALSQSMSSDRSFLEFYRTFIEYFANDEQVKFIISVRNSDLKYDPSLKIYEDVKTISMGLLSHTEVKGLLGKMNIEPSLLSQKLLELLRIPNHLNVFSQVRTNKSIYTANNILDLNMELWHQKVVKILPLSPVNRKNLKQFLYGLAQDMFAEQRISLSLLKYEDHEEEIRYLESQMLISIDSRQIQFFHQTFYDFVFAKQFVENGKSILNYIVEAGQSIHIRAAVKMIVNYLRDFDSKKYIQTVEEIFLNESIFFHIKHIIVIAIAEQQNPTEEEYRLIRGFINSSFHWQTIFLDNASPTSWLIFDIEEDLLKLLNLKVAVDSSINDLMPIHFEKAKRSAETFLNRAVQENHRKAWGVLNLLDNEFLILNALSCVSDWESYDSPAYTIFENIEKPQEANTYFYFTILNSIAQKNPEYSFEKIKGALSIQNEDNSTVDQNNLTQSGLIKTLAYKVPVLLFEFVFKLINPHLTNNISQDVNRIANDYRYKYVDFEEEDNLRGSEFFYRLLALCLNKIAKSDYDYFAVFFRDQKNTSSYAIMRLLIHAIENNIEQYATEVYELFIVFSRRGMLMFYDDLDLDIRELLQNAFLLFNVNQKQTVVEIITSFKSGDEIRIYKIDEKKRFYSNFGRSKFYLLKRLPFEYIQGEVRIQYLELERKFGKHIKDSHRSRKVLAGMVQSPISIDRCYKMNEKQWLNAFKRYSTERDHFAEDYLKGGKQELATTFKSTVKQFPNDDKVSIITRALEDSSIPLIFSIYGLSGWCESEADLNIITPLLKILLYKDLSYDKHLFLYIISSLVIELKEVDAEFTGYLVKESLDFQEGNKKEFKIAEDSETSIQNLVGKAINTDYSTATIALIKISDKRYTKLIFDTIKYLFDYGPIESRAAILYKFAYLINLDKKRAKEFFVDFINREKNIYVLSSSMWSFSYMRCHCLEEALAGYNELINSRLFGKDDCQSFFVSIYGLYLEGNEKMHTVIIDLFTKQRKYLSTFLMVILKNYYHKNENSIELNNDLLDRLLDAAGEENEEELNWSFLNAEHLKLVDIYPFVKRFVTSDLFKFSDYFVDYMILQLKSSPYESIELFQLAMNSKKSNEENLSYRIEEKCIKFIVNAYNMLHQNTEENKLIKISILKLFDKLLCDYRFTKSTDIILEELL